ncbi:MAG TPA: diguanylate cyclase [Nevskiaceae bacterium]|nr:diguanylate cyclase [Nevskiaceae bacterium]
MDASPGELAALDKDVERLLLIVDDNPDDRFSYRRLLGKQPGLRLRTAESESGEDGLIQAAALKPAAILLDYHLPDLNGLEFLQRLRAVNEEVAVVMLTGLDDSTTSVTAIKGGADDYLVKGRIEGETLVRALRNAITSRELQADLRQKQQRLELFYRLIDASSEVLFVVRMPQRQLIEINEAAVRALGYRRSEMLSPGFDLVRALPNFEENWQLVQRSGGERRFDSEGRRADGRRIPLEISGRRMQVGQAEYFVAVARDVTERRAFEAQLRRLTLQDGLTGVDNRRAFDERLAEEFARAMRNETPLGLLMVDIDHFKAYNDAVGHLAGDECLRRVAQTLQVSLRRPTDFVARYGGEEFAVVLADSPPATTLATARFLLERLRGEHLPHPANTVSPWVTASIGAAALTPRQGDSALDLVARADRQLYRAKAEGRNRALIDPPVDSDLDSETDPAVDR